MINNLTNNCIQLLHLSIFTLFLKKKKINACIDSKKKWKAIYYYFSLAFSFGRV